MMGVQEYFTDLSEGNVDLEIKLGDDSIVKIVGRGTITFQRESQPLMRVKKVLYVKLLAKSLISISAIENSGYDIVF
jgi:hypothetical protein